MEETTSNSPLSGFDSITVDDFAGFIPVKSSSVGGEPSAEATAEPVAETAPETPPAAPEAPPPPNPEKPQVARHKVIKAFLDDLPDGMELREDAKIDVTVNGVPKRMTIREVLDRQSSIENTDREYAKLRKEQDTFKNYLLDIIKQSNEGNALKALTKAMADQGHNPLDFIKAVRKELADQATQWSALTEEQKKILELEEENSYNKTQLERQAELARKEQEEQQLLQYVSQVEQQFGMPQGSWHDYYQVMQEEQQAGRVPAGEITIDQVGQFYRGVQDYKTVTDTLTALAPEVLADKELVGELLTNFRTNGLTREDLEDVVKELYPRKAEEAPKTEGNGFDAERAGRNLAEKVSANGLQKQTPRSDGETAQRAVKRPIELW